MTRPPKPKMIKTMATLTKNKPIAEESISLNFSDNAAAKRLLDVIVSILAEDYIQTAKENPEIFFFPKHKSHKKRKTGVGRKEKIPAKSEIVDNTLRTDAQHCGSRERTDMGKSYKKRSDDHEKSDTLK